jgi:hypothetical protein
VLCDLDTERYSARTVENFRAVLELPEAPGTIAVDMPIGLLGTSRRENRHGHVLHYAEFEERLQKLEARLAAFGAAAGRTAGRLRNGTRCRVGRQTGTNGLHNLPQERRSAPRTYPRRGCFGLYHPRGDGVATTWWALPSLWLWPS